MKEFETTFDKFTGLRPFKSGRRNEFSLVGCHNLVPKEQGLELHEVVTDMNATGVVWGGLGKPVSRS